MTTTLALENLVSHPLDFAGERLTVYNFAADQLINQSLSQEGVWEPWQLTLMRRIIREDFNCVDVGANIGINAMFMARCCPKGRVVAFEPFNAIYEVLRKNIAANGLRNLAAINKGISDSARTLHMVTNVNMVGGAHITDGSVDAAGHVSGQFRFGTLDEELHAQGIDRVDFIKIDVEGHELQVFTGADRCLRSNPNLQLIVEFNPAQLRRAISITRPFPDRQLLSLLKSYFRYVFYMNRDNTLTELKDYHALRRQLLGGYFVDDLYCTNTIPPQIADLIDDKPIVSSNVQVVRHNVAGLSVTSYNRDSDGWGLGSAHHPATVCLNVVGEPWRQLTIKLERIHKKHLHAGFPSWPVWVLIGDVGLTFDLLDTPARFSVETRSEPLDITIQSEHQTPASVYLGNPNDTRHVGVQVSFDSE